MPNTRREFSPGFKREAVALLESSGWPLMQVATEVGRPGRLRDNNRVENSHLPIRRRERKMQRFKSQGQAQRFVATHGPVYNNFNVQRHLIRSCVEPEVLAETCQNREFQALHLAGAC